VASASLAADPNSQQNQYRVEGTRRIPFFHLRVTPNSPNSRRSNCRPASSGIPPGGVGGFSIGSLDPSGFCQRTTWKLTQNAPTKWQISCKSTIATSKITFGLGGPSKGRVIVGEESRLIFFCC
jgi:hypothetical protein